MPLGRTCKWPPTRSRPGWDTAARMSYPARSDERAQERGRGVPVVVIDRTPAALAYELARHYMNGESWREIAAATGSSTSDVHEILSELFAEGMPKLKRRRMTDDQVRAIYADYLRGRRSIAQGAQAVGFTRRTVERRLRALELTVKRTQTVRPSSPAHAEQRLITSRLMERVEELRRPKGLTLEGLARASGLSPGTLHHLRYELREPRLMTVLRLCRGLRVSPGQLIGDLPLPVEPHPRRGSERESARVSPSTVTITADLGPDLPTGVKRELNRTDGARGR